MMKHCMFSIIGLILFVFVACHEHSDQREFELSCNTNTFDAPISCISQSSVNHDKIFIGLEDGSIIEKNKNNWKANSLASNHRIYDILEHANGLLFVGSRDAGLKLLTTGTKSTQSFRIEGKNLNYSAYSIAKDSIKQTLYVGTSNGFYKLDLSNNVPSDRLEPIALGNSTQDFGVNKIILKNQTLYIASDLGLFIVEDFNKDTQNPVIDTSVKNITLHNDTVYAITESSIIKVCPDRKKTVVRQGEYSFYKKGINLDEWYLTSNSVVYNKNGQQLTHQLPEGISENAKQVASMGDDFFYVAYKKKLISFALHQNIAGAGNNVIAVSDKTSGEMIYFITNDLRMHRYKFKYNQPELKSEPLGIIEGIESLNDVVKLVEAEHNTFYLATRKKLYRIQKQKATCILLFDDAGCTSSKANRNCINTLYYSPTNHKLYIGTRKYFGYINDFGSIDKQDRQIVTRIPILTSKGYKDTIDTYVVDICEKEDSLYVATLNKGLYGKPSKDEQSELKQLLDLTDYESTYGIAIGGGSLYLNTAKGIVHYPDTLVLPVKNVKSIYGVRDKNPNEGYFILYHYGLSFKPLEDHTSPIPQFKDLAFDKSCIALNGRKAVLGCQSGLFYYDGKSELTSISIEESNNSDGAYILAAIISLMILTAFALYLYRIRQRKSQPVTCSQNEIEADLSEIDRAVKELFDHLGNKSTEAEEIMRKELKQKCIRFVDKYPELGKLSFMKRRGKERYCITVLLLIEDIDANIISRTLDIDQMTVNRHKYNARKEIEQLYEQDQTNYPVIHLLYERIKTSRKMN